MIDFTLMEHQKEAIFKATVEPDLFLAWEMGTGKSCATVQILRQIARDKGRMPRTLILAPLVVLRNWKKELNMFSKFDQKDIYVLDGPVKKRIQLVTKQKGYSAIFITNYDAMQDDGLLQALIDWGPEVLVSDESHYVKNYKSKRAKNVAKIADVCERRLLLTGTPILNSTMDLFMQFRILDGYRGRESTFGANFFAFRARYFYDANSGWQGKANYFPKWEPREELYSDLMTRIARKTLRVTKKECLDLPDLITTTMEVDLNAEQKRMYEEMRKEYITFIESETKKGTPQAVVARIAITKVLRLQQIVSGFVKTETGQAIRIADVPRLNALSELLETLTPGHKVIVWATFRENYAMIKELCEKLKIKYAEIHGEQSGKEKAEAQTAFEKDPLVRVCISNQSAGGVGISLVQASYAIYYSRGFRLGDDLQSEARNHRRGSEIHDKITRINLVSNGTIDELISEALKNKQNIAERILDFATKL